MLDHPVIRRAGPADAARLRALTRAAYARWVPVLGREPLPMGFDYAALPPGDRVDLAEDGEGVAALVHLRWRREDVLVENLAVAPGRQGAGLGACMLAHAERLAVAAGRPTVRLYTNAAMAANVAFYRARGYRIEREEALMGGTCLHLVKTMRAEGVP